MEGGSEDGYLVKSLMVLRVENFSRRRKGPFCILSEIFISGKTSVMDANKIRWTIVCICQNSTPLVHY